MATNDFNSAAVRPNEYVFDLEKEVAAFYRAYPDQASKIYFIDSSGAPGMLYRGGLPDEDETAERLGHNGGLALNDALAHKEGSRSDLYESEGYGCVHMNTTLPSQQYLLGHAAGKAVSDVFIFDHEIGHLLCKDGLGSLNMGECVADAYATIRHIQRFGAGSSALQRLQERRAMEMIFGRDGSHFTAPVVERIVADSAHFDFAALSPQETAGLAQQYAAANIMEPGLINYLIGDFKRMNFGMAEIMRGDFRPLLELGEVVLRTSQPAEFKWGAAAIKGLFSGDFSFDGVRLPTPGHELDSLLKGLVVGGRRFGAAAPRLA